MEKPTSDEKVLAALAHVSALLAFLGPVGSTLIWVSQRNKSKYVRFHALQAMGYQALIFWGWVVGIFIAAFGAILLSIGIAALLDIDMTSETPVLPFLIQIVLMFAIFGLWGLFFLGGIVGAVFCLMGRDFRYPIIGSWLKRKLFDAQPADDAFEEWEENWVGGVCHLTAILQLWGIITPLIVWFSQKQHSAKLGFQALQAAIYQLIATVTYFIVSVLGGLLYFVFIFGMLAVGFSGNGIEDSAELPPAVGILSFLFIGMVMLFSLAYITIVPLYYLLAAVAGIRTIRGHDFKYPILGKIISRRTNHSIQKEIISS